jgi:phenylalanine-4-hydroxylase
MGKPVSFRFSSGISLEGVYEGEVKRGHTTVILSLSSCTIRIQDRVLFQPEWGTYDMACGFDVHSVFGGPADRESYMHALGEDHPDAGQQKSNLTIETEGLNQLYSKVRGIREGLVQGRVSGDEARSLLEGLYRGFCQDYREDWLLRYELIELSVRFNLKLVSEGAIREELRKICLKSQDLRELIQRGLEVI